MATGTSTNACGNPILAFDNRGWGLLTAGVDGERVGVTDHNTAREAYRVIPTEDRPDRVAVYLPHLNNVHGGDRWLIGADHRALSTAHVVVHVDWYGTDGEYLGQSTAVAAAAPAPLEREEVTTPWLWRGAQVIAPEGAVRGQPFIASDARAWELTGASYRRVVHDVPADLAVEVVDEGNLAEVPTGLPNIPARFGDDWFIEGRNATARVREVSNHVSAQDVLEVVGDGEVIVHLPAANWISAFGVDFGIDVQASQPTVRDLTVDMARRSYRRGSYRGPEEVAALERVSTDGWTSMEFGLDLAFDNLYSFFIRVRATLDGETALRITNRAVRTRGRDDS